MRAASAFDGVVLEGDSDPGASVAQQLAIGIAMVASAAHLSEPREAVAGRVAVDVTHFVADGTVSGRALVGFVRAATHRSFVVMIIPPIPWTGSVIVAAVVMVGS